MMDKNKEILWFIWVKLIKKELQTLLKTQNPIKSWTYKSYQPLGAWKNLFKLELSHVRAWKLELKFYQAL